MAIFQVKFASHPVVVIVVAVVCVITEMWFHLIDIYYDPQIMESSGAPSVTLIVGSGLSCLALITLAVVYAALWRYVINMWF